MQTLKYAHWRDGDSVLGYLVDYPDYWTQGDSLDDLKDHLVDLYRDLTSGELIGVRQVDELVIPPDMGRPDAHQTSARVPGFALAISHGPG